MNDSVDNIEPFDTEKFIQESITLNPEQYSKVQKMLETTYIKNLQGIMDGSIKAPTIVAFDPMNKLWFSHFVLKYIAPFIPGFLLSALKPLIKWLKLRTIEEEVQKIRADEFVRNACLWKWKRAAQQTTDFVLFGNLHKIEKEIMVVNGTNDTIHDQTTYPRIARELLNGRFIFLGTDENQRERLIGLIGKEFSMITKEQGIPEKFKEFEKDLHRNSSLLV